MLLLRWHRAIGSYSLEGGQPETWLNLADTEFLARGSAVDTDGTLLLGRGDEIYRLDPNGDGELQLLGTVPGPSHIEGLAVDASRNELLVVDGANDLLVALSLDR